MEFSPIEETELEEELCCCFCLELYRDPVVLDCCHNLCRSHIVEMAKLTEEKGTKRYSLHCPICREVCHRAELSGFKTNLALANVIDIMKKIKRNSGSWESPRNSPPKQSFVPSLPPLHEPCHLSLASTSASDARLDSMVRIIKVTDLVFVGGNSYVQAIDSSGDIPLPFWCTRLPGAAGLVAVVCELDKVYAASNGYLYCLEASTGLLIWSQKVNKSTFLSEISVIIFGNFLIAGVSGYVIAVMKDTGDEVWHCNLKGTGYRVVTLQTHLGELYAGTAGAIFSLDPIHGTVLWKNKMNGFGVMGVSFICFDDHLLVGMRGYLLEVDIDGELTGYNPVSLLYLERTGEIIASSHGQIICYSETTKQEIWRNSLSGCGYPLGSTIAYYKNKLWVGLNGKFLCLNPTTGDELFRFDLQGCSGFVSLIPFNDYIFIGGEGYFGAYHIDTGFLSPINIRLKGNLFFATSKNVQDCSSSNLLVMQETFNERVHSRGLGLLYS